MAPLIIAAILALLALFATHFTPERFRWRRATLLVVGVASIFWALCQGYMSLTRVAYLETKVGSVECIQSQASGRHFTPEQRLRLEKRLADFPGVVVNVWIFKKGMDDDVRTSLEKTRISADLVAIFRAAKWKSSDITVRQFPFPDAPQSILVRHRDGAEQKVALAVEALTQELARDCIVASSGPPFTDNGDYGQRVLVDQSGAHPDTSQSTILSAPPLANPDVSILVGRQP